MDKETNELIERVELRSVREQLRSREEAWEREKQERQELARLTRIAQARNPGMVIFTPLNHELYHGLPVETRLQCERLIDEVRREEAAKRAVADRAEKRERDHQAFLERKAAAEEAERQRRLDNIKTHGDLRPETTESFGALPAELKIKITGLFGGDQFLRELALKQKSGLTWQQWDKLKAFDPNAQRAEASEDKPQ